MSIAEAEQWLGSRLAYEPEDVGDAEQRVAENGEQRAAGGDGRAAENGEARPAAVAA